MNWRFLFFLILILIPKVLLSQGSTSFGDLNITREFRDRAFRAEVRTTAGSQMTTTLVRRDGGEIVMRPPGVEGEDVLIFTAVREITSVNFLLGQDFNLAREAMRSQAFSQAFQRLRPLAYGLLPYQDVPSENLFLVFESYLQVLLTLEELEEAYYFAMQVRPSTASSGFIELMLSLSQSLVDIEETSPALTLLDRLPFDQGDEDRLLTILQFANTLRNAGRYEDAIQVYGRLSAVQDNPLGRDAIFWIAYSNVRLERVETALLFLEEAGGMPETSDPFFSLYQMINARILMQQERTREAIRVASRGIVFSRLDQEWTPDLLFMTAEVYEELEMWEQAGSIFEEITLFFPNNALAKPSRERLAEIKLRLGS
jgi:tetratricopeptide (TPR) repeat protein